MTTEELERLALIHRPDPEWDDFVVQEEGRNASRKPHWRDRLADDPTPDEIAVATARIREAWTEEEFRARAGIGPTGPCLRQAPTDARSLTRYAIT